MALPLKGLRVIDLSQDFAGPFCTMILADLGAEVIKVEKPSSGDETRSWGPPFVNGQSYYFLSLNRGKKSIVLDLKRATSQRIIRQLVQDADIFVESFRPGKLARYKLDYQNLCKANKALVYCSITGFGQTGPYRNRPAYDLTAFAMSGIMSTTGEEARPPVRVSVPVADIAAGHYASTGILACLSRRLVTGRGDHIDLSLYDSIVSWLTYLATYYFATGREPRRMGSTHASIVPYQAFNCKDKPLVIAVGNDAQWTKLCQTLELKKLVQDRRFKTNPQRVKNRRALIPILARRLKSASAEHWTRQLIKSGVPAAQVYSIADVKKDPHVKHRRFFKPAEPGMFTLSSPIRLDEDGRNSAPAPRLGQHTSQVLRELGYSKSQIADLS